MRLPKEFKKYVDEGIIRKAGPDRQKAEFLEKESEKEFRGLGKRLKVMGIDEDNAGSIIKDCYDILMSLIRSKLLTDGYSSSGNFAHEAEASYLREIGFTDNEIYFMNELRYNRNSVMYYGKHLDAEYAKKVVGFAKKFYPKLRKITGGAAG